jgi:hypothetical protein
MISDFIHKLQFPAFAPFNKRPFIVTGTPGVTTLAVALERQLFAVPAQVE